MDSQRKSRSRFVVDDDSECRQESLEHLSRQRLEEQQKCHPPGEILVQALADRMTQPDTIAKLAEAMLRRLGLLE